MFNLTTIADLVQIIPEDFRKKSIEAIEDNLNAKYSNRVIQNIGLGICFYDLLESSNGQIGHNNTGVVNVNVVFRLIVFRPFRSEIVCGKIASANENGMKIRLDFFDDIWVPKENLFENSGFSIKDQCWIWHNEGQNFYYDRNEWVRVRVEKEHWHDISPTEPWKREEREEQASSEKVSPYSITGSMKGAHLGPVMWW